MIRLLPLLLCSCLSLSEYEIDLASQPEALSRVVKLDLRFSEQSGSCNGYLLESRAVLTAAHCVAAASWIGVRRSVVTGSVLQISYQADRYEVARFDARNDVAILLPFREMGASVLIPAARALYTNETVYFYDHALILRRAELTGTGLLRTDFSAEQRAWAVNYTPHRGDSGGPVFDECGALVGVIVAGDFERGLLFIVPLESLAEEAI